MLQREKLSFIFADDNLERNVCLPADKHDLEEIYQTGLTPSIVAVIFGALLACGLLNGGNKVTAIRPVRVANPWKLAGILDLMAGRI